MKISSIVRALVAANASPEMILAAVEAAENEFSAEAESMRNADEIRKEQARARWHKWNETKGRNVSKRLQTLANDQQTTHASASPACSNTLSSEPKGSSEVKEERKKETRVTALVVSPEAELIEAGVDPETLKAWKGVRKEKRAGPISKPVVDALRREAFKADISMQQAVTICCERGWQGFKADWLIGSRNNGPPPARRTASHAFMELAREQKIQESGYDNLVDFTKSLSASRLISG